MLRAIRRNGRRALDRERQGQRETTVHRLSWGIELMEPRLTMSVQPVFVGAIYIEEDPGSDRAGGDTFHVSFEGGVAGSQLMVLEINGDQVEPGFGVGDVFFDTATTPGASGAAKYGAEESFNFRIIRQEGIDEVRPVYSDGTSLLRLEFRGFDPGDKLEFSIDVDEVEDFDPNETDVTTINYGFDPITSGVEFQGSQLKAIVKAPNFADATLNSKFFNRYDDALQATPLQLPLDNQDGKRDRTAGSVAEHVQEPVPASLSGHVFHDRNMNGQRDEGEEPIANAEVRAIPLETVADQETITVRTNALGQYQFANLMPGRYRIEEAQPQGYLDGLDRAGTIDGRSVGRAVNPGDLIDDILLSGGSSGIDYDFGEILPVSLSGRVHLATTDGDCFSDIYEHRPVVGAVVQLFNADGELVTETVTDSDGRYAFVNVAPGTYSVREITPEGLFDGGAMPGEVNGRPRGVVVNAGEISQIQLGSGDEITDIEFCEKEPISIAGRVHLATPDGDCFSDLFEHRPVVGAVVRLLDTNGAMIQETRTNERGEYRFDGLEAGIYAIQEITPEGLFDGGARPGTVNGTDVRGTVVDAGLVTLIEAGPGEDVLKVDFCEKEPASIRGRVQLATVDGDCFTQSIDHPPLAGVEVRLYNADGQLVGTERTNAQGEYAFQNLEPGTYRLFEVTPENVIDGGAQAGTIGSETVGLVLDANSINEIVLGPSQSATEYLFCEFLPSSLAGFVYHDANNDGIKSGTEAGLAGVALRLINGDGTTVATQSTNEDGSYRFTDLPAGVYRVVESHPTDWLDGLDTAGTIDGQLVGVASNPGDEIAQIDLGWGQSGVEYNFGELLSGAILGRVHLSSPNGDCFGKDEDHQPLEGVVIQLLDDRGQLIAETKTDADGQYEFSNLRPGRYVVNELTPDGLFEGGAQLGRVGSRTIGVIAGNSTVSDLILNSGEKIVEVEFCEHAPSDLSGFVYHDRNDDGQRQSNEEPIQGVVLRLIDAQGAEVGQTVTDNDGSFRWDQLEAGTYRVVELQPNGWIDGQDRAGHVVGVTRGTAINPGDEIVSINLGWGESAVEYAFGELMPATIAGIVHTDLNSDCILQPGEMPLSGVTIELLDADGRVVTTQQTDAEGRFFFQNLRPGEYSLREIQPEGYFQGGQRVGTGGGDDTVADLFRAIRVATGDQMTDYVFCEEPAGEISGFVFQDGEPIPLFMTAPIPSDIRSLRDGQLTSDDRRLPGVTLELREGVTARPITGSEALPGYYGVGPIRTVTDANGYYEFKGLKKGNYAVYQIQPDGYLDGIDTQGPMPSIAVNRDQKIDPQIMAALTKDPNFDAIIRIQLPPAQIATDNNFSEVLVQRTTIFFPGPQPGAPPALAPIELPVYTTQPRIVEPLNQPLANYGRMGRVWGQTWHLSVIDGGQPRGQGQQVVSRAPWSSSGTSLTYPVAFESPNNDWMRWELFVDGHSFERTIFGSARGTPIAGDFNGDGRVELGIFLEGHWFIDINGNQRWDEGDLWAKLGYVNDQPVVGDWDGDGKDDIGVFGLAWPGDPRAVYHEAGLPDRQNTQDGKAKNVPPSSNESTDIRRELQLTANGSARSDVIDHVFHYGVHGDHGVVGDWNGDGISSIATFHNGVWRLDINGDGDYDDAADRTVEFGHKGDIPLAGDFNGDGVDEIAILSNGRLIIDTNRNYRVDDSDQVLPVPTPHRYARAVVGDWDNDGDDDVAVAYDNMRFVEVEEREARRDR